MQKKETIQPTAQELNQAGEINHEITTGKRHNGAWTVETILPGDRLEFSTMKRGREISCVLRVIDSVKRSPGVTVVNWQYGNPSEVMARREARATRNARQTLLVRFPGGFQPPWRQGPIPRKAHSGRDPILAKVPFQRT